MQPGDVSVVVPVGGTAPFWDRCAESLAALDPAPGELITVLDGRNDALAARADAVGARVLVLEPRGGPAKARNHGAREATGELLLFLDSDVEAPPGLIAEIADVFTQHDRLTAVMGSYDDNPGHPGFVSQYRNLLHHFVHQTGRERAATFWAGCGAVRRRAFLDLEGFDAGYAEPSIEDIELGSRLRHAGHEIRLAKQVQVKHLKRWRLGDMLATDLFRRAVPWTRLMLRQGELVNDLNVKTRDRIGVVLAFLPLVAAPMAWLWPPLAAVAAGAVVLMVALNAGFFRFLLRLRGPLFALGAVPLYWAYLLICGLGFALGVGSHLLGRNR